jgi:hypothetical protein
MGCVMDTGILGASILTVVMLFFLRRPISQIQVQQSLVLAHFQFSLTCE